MRQSLTSIAKVTVEGTIASPRSYSSNVWSLFWTRRYNGLLGLAWLCFFATVAIGIDETSKTLRICRTSIALSGIRTRLCMLLKMTHHDRSDRTFVLKISISMNITYLDCQGNPLDHYHHYLLSKRSPTANRRLKRRQPIKIPNWNDKCYLFWIESTSV